MKNPTYITRGKKPYQQYFFRCRIPKDLKVFLGCQDEFRVSLKSSLLSQSRIISFDLYQLSQYIFQEMRQGNMRDITIDDVKRILRDKVEQTLKQIHHYHWDTNRFDEEEVQKRIAETLKKEQELSFHSFRHSVETHLTEMNVNPRYINHLQGHAQKDIGGEVYMKGIPPEQLLTNCVSKINWRIDFSKLKIKWK